MKPNHKKMLKEIDAKAWDLKGMIEDLKEAHEEWMNDHEYDWEDTKSGQMASDNDYSLDEMNDAIQEILDKIEEINSRSPQDY